MEHFVISPDLAGQKNVLLGEVNGIVVKVDFPTPPDEYAWVSVEKDGKPVLIGIRNLWLRAYMTTTIDTLPAIEDVRDPTEAEVNESIRLYGSATEAAEEVLGKFLDMA